MSFRIILVSWMLFVWLLLVASSGGIVQATPCIPYDDPLNPGWLSDNNDDEETRRVSPKYSNQWSVDYFATHKIVRHVSLNLVYYLYPCGAAVPSNVNATALLEIPLAYPATTQTSILGMMDALGLRQDIAAFLSNPLFIANQCIQQEIDNGTLATLDDSVTPPVLVRGNEEFAEDDNSTSSSWTKELVTFVSSFEVNSDASTNPPFVNTMVAVTPEWETTNQAAAEWIKYVSVFFDQETVANAFLDMAETRVKCIRNATAVATMERKPKLLWGYYSEYCQGWSVGTCPNYYCEYAEVCGAEFMAVDATTGSNQIASDRCGASYLTDDEFFAHASDADVWLSPAEIDLARFASRWDEIKAWRQGRVYDNWGRGPNAWFEQRFVEYDTVMEDICRIVGTLDESRWTLSGRRPFWRNVFTENATDGMDTETCDDQGSALLDRWTSNQTASCDFFLAPTAAPTAAPTGSALPSAVPTAFPSEAPTEIPSAIPSMSISPSVAPLQLYEIDSVIIMSRMARSMDARARIDWEISTASHIRRTMADLPVESELTQLTVIVDVKSQVLLVPENDGPASRNRRELQSQEPSIALFPIQVDFVVRVTFWSAYNDYNIVGMIGQAFNSEEDREQYINRLQLLNEAFGNLTSVSILVNGTAPPEEPSDIALPIENTTVSPTQEPTTFATLSPTNSSNKVPANDTTQDLTTAPTASPQSSLGQTMYQVSMFALIGQVVGLSWIT